MKKRKILWRCFFESLIPAVLCYLGQSNNVFNYLQKKEILGEGVNIELIQEICSWMGIAATFLLLTIPLAVARNREQKVASERNDLIRFWKEVLVQTLENKLDVKNLQINIRIFVPNYTPVTRIRKFCGLKYELFYKIKNYDFLAEKDTTEGLQFEVFPNPQGLVGTCYSERKMQIDDMLEETNEKQYNLKEYQKNKTRNLKFSIVCPIFSNDGNDEVISVMAFDCNHKIELTERVKQKELENSVLNFSQLLSSSAPELFK